MRRTLLAAFAFLLLACPTRAEDGFYLEKEDGITADAPFSLRARFRLKPGAPDDIVDALSGDFKFLDRIARWQLQIYDFYDKKIDFVQGRGIPASDRFAWTGLTPDGDIRRDGFYKVVFAWADLAGTMHRTEPVQAALLSPPGLRELLTPQVRVAVVDDDLILRLAEEMTFSPGKWEVKPDSIPALERIADFLNRYPQQRVLVQGHADATGPARANMLLSRERAKAVHAFLVDRGIDPSRVTFEGMGSSHPIATNATEAGRTANRRVEIILPKATI